MDHKDTTAAQEREDDLDSVTNQVSFASFSLSPVRFMLRITTKTMTGLSQFL